MGVDLKDLVPKTVIDMAQLSGKTIAIDAYNALYQFLATIRQPDGALLMDSRRRITSHLNGLLFRTINMLENGIRPIYVFDGKPPELKQAELARRLKAKEVAAVRYAEALAKGDLERARIYAQQTSRLTKEMVNDAKKLLSLMGIPWVQAPSEGEAQAAHLVRKGDAWASASQDYDSLLYGAPRLIRNLTITGKRKLPRRHEYVEVKPELVELDKVLETLGITRKQLVDVAILAGTDYNPGGVKGVGAKTALRLIKQYGCLEKALVILPQARFPVDPAKIRELFLKPDVTDNYEIKWNDADTDGIKNFLCYEHDFSPGRVEKAVNRLVVALRTTRSQSSLDSWF